MSVIVARITYYDVADVSGILHFHPDTIMRHHRVTVLRAENGQSTEGYFPLRDLTIGRKNLWLPATIDAYVRTRTVDMTRPGRTPQSRRITLPVEQLHVGDRLSLGEGRKDRIRITAMEIFPGIAGGHDRVIIIGVNRRNTRKVYKRSSGEEVTVDRNPYERIEE